MFKRILAIMAMLVISTAQAQAPQMPVTATIGFAPGSGNELSFRAVSALVEKKNPGVNFIVDLRPGADEIIALTHFGEAAPNGRSLYVVSQNNFALIETWFPGRLKFKMDELVLVTNIAKSPLCIVANANSTVNTPKELIDRIKTTKTPINFGLGSAGQKLIFEFMMEKTKGNSDMVQSVLYKGPGPVLQDLAGGNIEFAIIPTAVANTMAQSGKIKFIALASEYKLAKLPNVPLMKDYVKDLYFYAAWGLALPIGSTKEQVDYYRNLFVPVINSAEAKEFFDNNMMLTFPAEQSPEGMRKNIEKVNAQWGPYAAKHNPNK
jgi:tripartite-type tricarboxylate transporter receptor subunit TctC